MPRKTSTTRRARDVGTYVDTLRDLNERRLLDEHGQANLRIAEESGRIPPRSRGVKSASKQKRLIEQQIIREEMQLRYRE